MPQKRLTQTDQVKQVDLPPDVEDALHRLVDYVFDEEHKDFIASDKPPQHIFLFIQAVNNWLFEKVRDVV